MSEEEKPTIKPSWKYDSSIGSWVSRGPDGTLIMFGKCPDIPTFSIRDLSWRPAPQKEVL